MSRERYRRAAIIGGGIVGLAIARRIARDGWRVQVLEKARPGQEASSAAAGLIAPRLEFAPDSPVLEIGLASQRLYPEFVRELAEETGVDADLRLDGIIVPAADGAPAAAVPEGATLLAGRELRELEPGLNPRFTTAFFHSGQGSVDNRALVQALAASCRARGVVIHEETEVVEVLTSGGRVVGVRTPAADVSADLAINCAGAWAGLVRAGPGEVRVRPIKGQMLLLDRGPGEAPPRFAIYSPQAYVVPRSDGRVIVGTTVEDRGFDKVVEAGAVARLLAGAIDLCPSLAAARFADAWAGLRPRGEEEMPILGPRGPSGYLVAAGHYRNGILLAPYTAAVMAEQVAALG